MRGEASVFHPDAFKAASFLPLSWLGLALVTETAPAGGGLRKRRAIRPIQAPAIEWDTDEDEALLLMTGAL